MTIPNTSRETNVVSLDMQNLDPSVDPKKVFESLCTNSLAEKVKVVAGDILFFGICGLPGISTMVFLPVAAVQALRAVSCEDMRIRRELEQDALDACVLAIPFIGCVASWSAWYNELKGQNMLVENTD
jgi:hypothetical protein